MRFLRQLRGVGADFSAQVVVFLLPVHRVDRDEKRENARAFDVSQELQTQALPFVRALDDAWDVRDHERSPVRELYDTEVWRERRERIVRDLWPRGGDDGQ